MKLVTKLWLLMFQFIVVFLFNHPDTIPDKIVCVLAVIIWVICFGYDMFVIGDDE